MDDLAAVRETLAEARRQGLDFDRAWREALAGLPKLPLNSAPGQQRDAALCALSVTADSWRAAYLGQPAPRHEIAAARLQSLVAEPF
ncbi:MAG: hypothetical protein QOH72_5505 [Solirubrobacteraceae bacterium]|nr:hypothetical protein [Solirubrobacteraceae bacterium]